MKPLGRQIVAEFIYCSKIILNDKKAIEQTLKLGIKESGLTLKNIIGHQFQPAGATVIAVISESHIAIHTYPEAGHASVDIFTCANGSKSMNKLLRFLKSNFKPKTSRVMEIHRGNPLELKLKDWVTSFSGAGFEVRYHIKKELLSKRTRYQQMDIIENESFGRMMFLDKDLQIAEKDAHIYSENMVSPIIKAKNSFKKVAILGGGDGGVLSELLKYKPKSAYLIEIDEDVIKASKKYLPKICNNSFNNSRAKIVIDDANKFLETKHGFDAIIYDLTMHPESITRMERITFLNELFLKIKTNLNKNGMISLQCCSEFDTETLKLLKKILPTYFKNIVYRTYFIPSFCENWVFASAEIK